MPRTADLTGMAFHRLSVLVLVVALCGCSAAAASPPATPGPSPRPSSREVVAAPGPAATAPVRLTPFVLGHTVDELRESARRAKMGVRVMAFDDDGTITRQDPAAGQPVPSDGYLVVWLGIPERPEPVVDVVVETASVMASTSVTTDAADTDTTPSEPARGETIAADPADVPEPRPSATAPVSQTKHPAHGYPSIRTLPPPEPGLVLSGKASWYGKELAGSPVACGGVFDPTAATIASRELRCGTHVRITGPTGAETDAIVTDWGPAPWTGKRFDLSMATFERLAPLSRGWIDVEIEVID